MSKKREKTPVSAGNPVQLSEKVMAKKDAPVLLTFDRWFALQGRPAHHKGGMKAFATTAGKKTVEAWDRIFRKY